MTRIAIEGANDLAIDEWAIKWLKSRGYVVAPLENWEMPGEMCKRLKVSSAHLSSTLKDRRCPKPLDEIRGESGPAELSGQPPCTGCLHPQAQQA